VDLPWEYVRRRDREGAGLMSGFLLLDPSISMVRQRGDTNIAIEAIKGRQSLPFVGTKWATRGDVWQVNKEFGPAVPGIEADRGFHRTEVRDSDEGDGL
jgi:hypothetical protein